MKNTVKKALAFIMAFTFVFGYIQVLNSENVAFAGEEKATADGFKYGVIADTVFITGYEGSETDIEVPATIEGKPVVAIDYFAFSSNKVITSVKLNENLQVIRGGTTNYHKGAFWGCENLKTITIPDSVILIDDCAFQGCKSLEKVKISESSKLERIGEYSFANCEKLENIYVPDSVKTVEAGAFAACTSLKSVTGFKNVEFIGRDVFNDTIIYNGEDRYTWNDYGTPDEIYVGSFLVAVRNCGTSYQVREGTKIIGTKAFYIEDKNNPCANVTTKEIILPQSLKLISERAFYGCEALENITIPSNVEKIDVYAFGECYGLKSVSFAENSSLKEIAGHAFYNCSSLESVEIPEGTETLGSSMLIGTKVKEITLPASLKNLGAINGDNIEKIVFTGDVTIKSLYAMTKKESFMLLVENGSMRLPEGTFGDYAIEGMDLPENFEITVSRTGEADAETKESLITTDAYGNQYIGKCLVKANPDAEGVVDIRHDTLSIANDAFYGCKKITKLTGFENVTFIGETAFGSCTSLVEIDDLDNVRYIGYDAFMACENLSKAGSFKSIEYIDYGRQRTDIFGETSLIDEEGYAGACLVKAKVKSYASAATETFTVREGTRVIAPHAFAGTPYKNVVIPDSVVGIGDFAFVRGMNMESIVIPGSVKYIGFKAFMQNKKLKTVVIEDGTEKIGTSAFVASPVLELVHIPESVTVMNDSALYAENALRFLACFDTAGTYAEGFAIDQSIPFAYCDGNHEIVTDTPEIPDEPETPDTPEATIEEKVSSNGIKVEYDSSYFENNDDVVLVAEEKEGTGGNVGEYDENRIKVKRYDIHLEDKNGNVIVTNENDDKEYTVRIPVTAGYEHCAQFLIRHRMTLADGSTKNENIYATVEKGYVVFKTKCFSYFDICDFGFENEAVSLAYKSTAKLTATKIADAGVKYESSNPKVATVDENGNVITHGRGSATITATYEFEGSEIITDTCNVTVNFTFIQWIIYILLLGFLWY